MPVAVLDISRPSTHVQQHRRGMNKRFVNVVIGGMGMRFSTTDPAFASMLERRYQGFAQHTGPHHFSFEVHLTPEGPVTPESDVSVRRQGNMWLLQRGDFHATWYPRLRRGQLRQTNNPYSTDSVLRIVHSLVLASQHGFLLHASSAARNGKALLFSGVSGAGKTTIISLADAGSVLLTDEISYVRRTRSGFCAFGTPFAGDLGKNGENISAPIETAFLLAKGPSNKTRELSKGEAIRRLMRNVLFFANDPSLIEAVWETVTRFVCQVVVKELTFAPTPEVWDLIV